MDLEGGGSDLFGSAILPFAWSNKGKLQGISQKSET